PRARRSIGCMSSANGCAIWCFSDAVSTEQYIRMAWASTSGAEPLRQDGEHAGRDVLVLERSHHVFNRQDLPNDGVRAWTRRLIVKRTRMLLEREIPIARLDVRPCSGHSR